MARFDVYRLRQRRAYVVDCQSNLNSSFATRLLVPLIPADHLTPVNRRLNPVFSIEGAAHIRTVQGMQTIPARLLREPVMSLLDQDDVILAAIDALILGV